MFGTLYFFCLSIRKHTSAISNCIVGEEDVDLVGDIAEGRRCPVKHLLIQLKLQKEGDIFGRFKEIRGGGTTRKDSGKFPA